MSAIPPELLDELARHGVRPLPETEPALVGEFLNRLYVLQIADLRLRRRELEGFFGPQPLAPYQEQVTALRERYRVLQGLL